MKLFLISRNDDSDDYDIYTDAVVVAKSSAQAKTIHPSDLLRWDRKCRCWRYEPGREGVKGRKIGRFNSTWVDPDEVDVELVGTAKKGLVVGTVIIASFKAG